MSGGLGSLDFCFLQGTIRGDDFGIDLGHPLPQRQDDDRIAAFRFLTEDFANRLGRDAVFGLFARGEKAETAEGVAELLVVLIELAA
jgi:hypothetical protein